MEIYDAIVGFVDYRTIDSEKNGRWPTKMRCKKYGTAWLAENHVNGIETCPKCNTTEENISLGLCKE